MPSPAESPVSAPSFSPAHARPLVQKAVDAVGEILRGHPETIKVVFASVFAGGHVLLEDVPGVGKTTLARAVARAVGSSFSRIQFTADMLPADVLGVQILDGDGFRWRQGPIFAHVVLADEINRASPKTQSAMLEAMSEGSVTVDDETHALPRPFIVIATQNPVEHHGAYPLPESQLDRFMVSLSLGYPSAEEERTLLLKPQLPQQRLREMQAVLDPARVQGIQALVERVKLSDEIADYLLAIVEATRSHADLMLGASPRGALAFAAISRAYAFIEGRDYVLPDDIQKLAPDVLAHRIMPSGRAAAHRAESKAIMDEILGQVPVPR